MVQKWPFFQTFFFRQYRPGKCPSRYSRTKKAFLGYKNKKFKKSKNWHFFKGVNPSFWSKNGHFSKLFVLGNIGKENVFNDILEQKKPFLGYKNKKLKKSKNWLFPKGLNHGFGPKMAVFPKFFFRQYRPGKGLSRYFRNKKPFLGYKKKMLKKSKKWHFSKAVTSWFWSKNSHHSNVFFW